MLRNFEDFVTEVEALSRIREPKEKIRKALELLQSIGVLEDITKTGNQVLIKEQVSEIGDIVEDIKNILNR